MLVNPSETAYLNSIVLKRNEFLKLSKVKVKYKIMTSKKIVHVWNRFLHIFQNWGLSKSVIRTYYKPLYLFQKYFLTSACYFIVTLARC